MKKIILAFCLMMVSIAPSQAEPVEMVSYYIPGLVNSETEGSMVDMLKKISEISGIDFELKLMPTRRVQQAFQNGGINAYFPELEENRHYPSCRTSNMLQKQIIVFTKTGDPKITSIEGLHGKRVGAVSGYSYGTEIINNSAINIQYVDNDDTNLKKLLSGRVDAIVGDVHSTVNAITANNAEEKVYYDAENPINYLDVFFLFSDTAENKAICEQVSVALDQLKESGDLYNWFGYQ